ncbi:hypothetical protein C8R45DRAFT_937200 [Mycena sanguinolenta]|nr:hypothetical protein C8R45DRAFT_937200 [Mycena sanguinolenta]
MAKKDKKGMDQESGVTAGTAGPHWHFGVMQTSLVIFWALYSNKCASQTTNTAQHRDEHPAMIIEATALVLFMYGRKAFYLTLSAFVWVEKMCWLLWNKIIRKSVIRWCVHYRKPCFTNMIVSNFCWVFKQRQQVLEPVANSTNVASAPFRSVVRERCQKTLHSSEHWQMLHRAKAAHLARHTAQPYPTRRVQPLWSIQVNGSLIPIPTSNISLNVPGPPIHPKCRPRPKRPSSQSAFAFKPSSNSAFTLVLAREAAEDKRLLARLAETPEGKPELCQQESRSVLGDRKSDGASMDVDGGRELKAGMDLDKTDVDPFAGLSAEELENMTAEERAEFLADPQANENVHGNDG